MKPHFLLETFSQVRSKHFYCFSNVFLAYTGNCTLLELSDPLEAGMPTRSSVLAWRIPWTEEPGGLQSTGSQRAGHDRSASVHACTRQLCHVFAPGKGISDYNDSKLTPSSRHLLFGTVSQTSLPRSFPSEFSDAAARDLGCDESPRWKVTPRKHHRDGSISV